MVRPSAEDIVIGLTAFFVATLGVGICFLAYDVYVLNGPGSPTEGEHLGMIGGLPWLIMPMVPACMAHMLLAAVLAPRLGPTSRRGLVTLEASLGAGMSLMIMSAMFWYEGNYFWLFLAAPLPLTLLAYLLSGRRRRQITA